MQTTICPQCHSVQNDQSCTFLFLANHLMNTGQHRTLILLSRQPTAFYTIGKHFCQYSSVYLSGIMVCCTEKERYQHITQIVLTVPIQKQVSLCGSYVTACLLRVPHRMHVQLSLQFNDGSECSGQRKLLSPKLETKTKTVV